MSAPKLRRVRGNIILSGVCCVALAAPITAGATLPAWLQHIVGGSAVESALYRVMQLPAVQALYPRPPKEAQAELAKLIEASPNSAELYQLRSRADEQALNVSAAEADWKLYVTHAQDDTAAKLQLADFYERRLMIPQEIAVLKEVAAAAPIPSEAYIAPMQQRSWRAFERILGAIGQQGLPASETSAAFDAFLARYPNQPAVYAATLQFQMEQHDWPAATALIQRYRHRFPTDASFPIRAQALLEFRRGNVDAALSVYEQGFQPLWPAELTQSYFALLEQTHRQRAFVAAARADLVAHPDGPQALGALARIFLYEQQAGHIDTARQTLDAFRIARDARKAPWTPTDLYTLAQLSYEIHAYGEAARYNYALASSDGTVPTGEPAAQSGLAGLIGVLLEAPDQPLAVGAQNLTLYRDIATLDQGPGYWNGILSLWLNGTSPQSEYQSEAAKAQNYFHRSKAADLLAELDTRFPDAPERASLHAQLIRALATYGEPAAVIVAAREFLKSFPTAQERIEVTDAMADAYARQNDTADEFALYESELNELGAKCGGLPLTASDTAPEPAPAPGSVEFYAHVQDPESVNSDAGAAQNLETQPLVQFPVRAFLPEAAAYSRVLDRYIGRLTATGQLPRALTVLRGQLDRNPSDPLLYERLATFLQQNDLSNQEEQVFQQAVAKFQQPTYYDKLARFYLRQRKIEAFAQLARQVTDIFSGTELDNFFAVVSPDKPVGPQLALQLNLYAAKRFPHDLVFTHNLLTAYEAKPTRDDAAYEALLRNHWWEADDLSDMFLSYLSRTGKLSSELSQLQAMNSQTASSASANPAALREEAEIDIFTSHFEQAAPLLNAVVDLYPANADEGDQAVSLYRSLAYLDSGLASTDRAVALEKNLLAAYPDSPDRLATLGDLYAEATSTGGENLAAAAPYWRRIPELHPGSTQGFLTSSTIFWDYFQFDDALAEVNVARARFHSPTLFGYEAGAIEENRHDLLAAVNEYTQAVVHPIAIPRHFDSAVGAIKAWLMPPSDAADSNFHSTLQSFYGTEEASARLLELATRPSTKALVDSATMKAVTDDPAATAALTLRANVIAAQHQGPELKQLLNDLFSQALDRTTTLDEAAAVGTLAQTHNLVSVYQRALIKQAHLTMDPVQKIELQYVLARSLEDQNDIGGATRVIDAVHQDNPRILGVVRTTTDFYVRTKQLPLAIATLLEATKAATPQLARKFTLEAASRANDAGDTSQARSLALGMLVQTPYDAQVLDVVATSYARAHDDAGLKQFYLAQVKAAAEAPGLTPGDRKEDTAQLRRGLIPALTRMGDFAGAMDQYIFLLSAYPEDTDLSQQVNLYARQHDRQDQLLNFLRTTVKQSPHDSRFLVMLAQAETAFNDLSAAQDAYSLAINLRKDRVDLYAARADIETRLNQTDPKQSDLAAADFERLYVLSYRDPSWMIRLAELRARQQRPADAVKALKTAYIDGHPPVAADYFAVAAQLEGWNLLNDARTFSEQGVTMAGADLLTPPPAHTYPAPDSGAVIYARILTRLGDANQALATLIAARHAAEVAATSPSVLEAELARENVSADEANGFRRSFAAKERQLADQNMQAAILALGQTIRIYDTPEQKQAFALTLDKLHTPPLSGADPDVTLEVATAAGLEDLAAKWRRERLLTGEVANEHADLRQYATLEQARLQFSELAHTLEAYAVRLRPGVRDPVVTQAAQAFRSAGNASDEIRLVRGLVLRDRPQLRQRYFDLLLRRDPPALIALASDGNAKLADAALNYAVAHGTEAQALAAVAGRSHTLSPVWRPASASLVQTYFANPTSPPVDASDFKQSLDYDATIADRLSHPANPEIQLTGDTFFYYASRFGIFLATIAKTPATPDDEGFLPAELERSPESPTAYVHLAQTYVDAHDMRAASAEYNHALELSPASASIEDEFATALYSADRRDEAIDHWRSALGAVSNSQLRGTYGETWFTSFEALIRHLGDRHLITIFLPEIEAIMETYLTKNGNYRSNELLRTLYSSAATPAEGADLILVVTRSASDPGSILRDLDRAPWLSPESQATILHREIELAHGRPQDDGAQQAARDATSRLINLYLSENEVAKAQSIFDFVPRKSGELADWQQGIVLAVRNHRLQPLLDKWGANLNAAPAQTTLDAALSQLRQPTGNYKPDPTLIRPLLEFVFDFKDKDDTLTPTDFLSLAQARLDTGDLPGALDLLRRLTLQPQSSSAAESTPDSASIGIANPYVNTDNASSLLEKNHRFSEAIPFLESLVQSVPWDGGYRFRLAEAQFAINARGVAEASFLSVVRDVGAPYALRVRAAEALAQFRSQPVNLGSAELSFIAHSTSPTAARMPYFAAARITAAGEPAISASDRETLLREAIAIAPSGRDSDRARVDLLLLRAVAADPSATLAIFHSLQNAAVSTNDADTANAGARSASDGDEPAAPASIKLSENISIPSVSLPRAAENVDLQARTRVAAVVASAYQRDGNLDSALAYAQLCVDLATNAARPELVRRRDELITAVLLKHRNAARLPNIRATLAQAVQVRPRLTASAAKQEVSR